MTKTKKQTIYIKIKKMEDFSFNTDVNLTPLVPNAMDEIPTIGGQGRCVGFEEINGTNNLETFYFPELFDEDM